MSSLEKRIEVFRNCQNLEYRLTRNGENDCNCIIKSKLLGEGLSQLGIEWRYKLAEFSWAELGLPEQITSIPHSDPEVHKFTEILVPETKEWVFVDPTWDPGLKRVLDIPNWDGLSSTGCAVPIQKILNEKESEELYTRVKSQEYRDSWYEKNNDFVVAVNEWLVSNRAN